MGNTNTRMDGNCVNRYNVWAKDQYGRWEHKESFTYVADARPYALALRNGGAVETIVYDTLTKEGQCNFY